MAEEEVKKPWGILTSLTEGVDSIPLVDDETIVGKATIKSESRNISRRHFKIIRREKGIFFIQDCSTNGTFVNKERIKKGSLVKIKDGVDISVLNQLNPDSVSFMFMSYDDHENESENFIELCKKYSYGKYLGEGSYATVRLVTEKATGEQYAMKIINRSGQKVTSKRKEASYDEVNVLSRLSHPNIVNTKDIFMTENKTYIVMELVKGGDLFSRIMEHGYFSERNTRFIIRQVLEGIKYLHSQGIAHRDLKPENIMMVSDESLDVKIADFGLSRMVDSGSFMSTLCGTPNYVAPEVIQRKGYTNSVDIWSIGVITYVLISSSLPFFSDSKDELGSLYAKIVKGDFEFRKKEVWDPVSQECKDFIRSLLVVDPEARPTAVEALENPWFELCLGDESVIDKPEIESPSKKRTCSEETI